MYQVPLIVYPEVLLELTRNLSLLSTELYIRKSGTIIGITAGLSIKWPCLSQTLMCSHRTGCIASKSLPHACKIRVALGAT